jgi:hypothetical protein
LGNLSTPNSVRKLRRALHVKAKAEPGYRFYALYDKLFREDILAHAYRQCRANRGAPGIDGQDFADVEAYGVKRWLGELAFNPCNDVDFVNVGGYHNDGEAVEPYVTWLGELL